MKKIKNENRKNKKIILLIMTIIIMLILSIPLFFKNILINKIENVKEKQVEDKTETTYEIHMINENTGNDEKGADITVYIENNKGIKKVILPNEKELTINNWKNKLAIDYNIVLGQDYIFKVQLQDETQPKDYILKTNSEKFPEIIENESYLYPILTQNKVELNKKVEIDYKQNTQNYYSIDNGTTWNEYIESFDINKSGEVLAKTIVEGEITQLVRKKVNLNLASDALKEVAYDGNTATYIEAYYNRTSNKYHENYGGYLLIDESMKGKSFKITGKCTGNTYYGAGGTSRIRVKYYNEEEFISENTVFTTPKNRNDSNYHNINLSINIPNNATKMYIYLDFTYEGNSGGESWIRIYNVSPVI